MDSSSLIVAFLFFLAALLYASVGHGGGIGLSSGDDIVGSVTYGNAPYSIDPKYAGGRGRGI